MFDPGSDDLERATVLERKAVDFVPYLCGQIEEAERHVGDAAQAALGRCKKCVSDGCRRSVVPGKCRVFEAAGAAHGRNSQKQTALEPQNLRQKRVATCIEYFQSRQRSKSCDRCYTLRFKSMMMPKHRFGPCAHPSSVLQSL